MGEIWRLLHVVMNHGIRVGEERLLRRGGGGGGELFENRPWYGIRLLETWWSAQHPGRCRTHIISALGVRLVVVALVNVTRGADLTISVR